MSSRTSLPCAVGSTVFDLLHAEDSNSRRSQRTSLAKPQICFMFPVMKSAGGPGIPNSSRNWKYLFRSLNANRSKGILLFYLQTELHNNVEKESRRDEQEKHSPQSSALKEQLVHVCLQIDCAHSVKE